MEATQEVLTKEQRRQKALAFSRYMIASKRQTQKEMQEEIKDPNSALSKSFERLDKKHKEKQQIYAEV